MWTDDQIARLSKLWSEGLSASLIGEAMGYTRNAVLGKVFRLGLEKRSEREYPPISKQRSGPKRSMVRDAIELSRIRNRNRENRKRVERTVESRAFLRNCKAPKTSAAYRNHLPIMPDMSKAELRAMLTAAVVNTAQMEQA